MQTRKTCRRQIRHSSPPPSYPSTHLMEFSGVNGCFLSNQETVWASQGSRRPGKYYLLYCIREYPTVHLFMSIFSHIFSSGLELIVKVHKRETFVGSDFEFSAYFLHSICLNIKVNKKKFLWPLSRKIQSFRA
jgi:hypothetical protein